MFPSPDGSGILLWRRSPQEIECTAGIAPEKNYNSMLSPI